MSKITRWSVFVVFDEVALVDAVDQETAASIFMETYQHEFGLGYEVHVTRPECIANFKVGLLSPTASAE